MIVHCFQILNNIKIIINTIIIISACTVSLISVLRSNSSEKYLNMCSLLCSSVSIQFKENDSNYFFISMNIPASMTGVEEQVRTVFISFSITCHYQIIFPCQALKN